MSTLLPADKGTALVLALTIAGLAIALLRAGAAGAALLAITGLLCASAQGIAGEEGVPAVALVVPVLAGILASRGDGLARLTAAAAVAAIVLVAVAPADTSRVFSGDGLHQGEAAFLALGASLLGLVGGATAVLAMRRGDRTTALGSALLVGLGALAHGIAFLGAIAS